MIQLDAILIRRFRLEDFERPMDGAASQLLEVNAVRSKTFGEADLGKLGQLLDGVDAPAFEDLRHFIGERECRDIQVVEIRRDGDAGEITRGEDGGVGGLGDGDVDIFAGAVGDGLGDLVRGAVQALESVNAEDDSVGRGLLEGRRESRGDLRKVGWTVETSENHPIALALNCALPCRTGLRDDASNSTSRRSEKPGAPLQMVFLRSISSMSDAQDRAMGSLSASARMVGVFSMARRKRYQ